MKTASCAEFAEDRKITSGTKEWADYNVNCIEGCYNNCRYCYAKMMANRFGRRKPDAWEKMKIRQDMLTKKFKKRSGRVMFPSTHDIFGFSPFKEACFAVLERLLESGNAVLITTKPKLSVIREITQHFGSYREQMQFRFTITSNDDTVLEFWEPNAPRFKERLASLEYAYDIGFKTSVSIEPFLDYDPTELTEAVVPFVTESIWIGKMNYIQRKNLSNEEMIQYQKIRENYRVDHLWEIYNNLTGYPKVRFKDSVRIHLHT